MKRILNYTIPKKFDNMPILAFLKAKQYSAQIITHLKRTENGILKNGLWARVGDLLQEHDTLTITLIESEASKNIVPMPLPLDIVYEDEDLMVINKASDTPIHPSQGNHENTLANAVSYYFAQKNEPFTYRCINRLDRDTTGLLILAKHMYSASLLSNMVQKRKIYREYLAIADGLVPEEGMIDAPIGRKDGSTIERQVDLKNGEPARTHFKRLAYENGFSVVSLVLETGRTHQIRVHMKYIGHPLPGDFLYHPDYSAICRQALHSCRLQFTHPITGQKLDFTAALPDDMASMLRSPLAQ